jgi:hypothetical protein
MLAAERSRSLGEVLSEERLVEHRATLTALNGAPLSSEVDSSLRGA